MKKQWCAMLLSAWILLSLCVLPVGAADQEERNMISMFETGCIRDQITIPADFYGYIGNIITVGKADVTVTAMGRLWYEGNAEAHSLKLVEAESGSELASVTVSEGTEGEFRYAELATPVTLKADGTYYLLSEEDIFGDYFGDADCGIYCTGAMAVNGYVYTEADGRYETKVVPGGGYLGLDLKYRCDTQPSYDTVSEETPAFSSISPISKRNNFNSYVGAAIYIQKPIVVTELARVYLEGNTQTHAVMLIDAETYEIVPGAVALIQGGETIGDFQYVKLEAPVLLEGERLYYLVSREYYKEGTATDFWYEGDCAHTPSDREVITGCGTVFYISDFSMGAGEFAFVGLNLRYMLAEEEPDPGQSSVPESAEPTQSDTEEEGTTAPGQTVSSEVTSAVGTIGKEEDSLPIPLLIGIGVVAAAAVVCVILIVRKRK